MTRLDTNQTNSIAAEGMLLCINNADSLLKAAKALFNDEHYREAYLLASYADEELGKIITVSNFSRYYKSSRFTAFLKKFKNHGTKFRSSAMLTDSLLSMLSTIESFLKIKTYKDLRAHPVLEKRLKITYVDFSGNKFLPPHKISKDEAQKFLKTVESHLQQAQKSHPSYEETLSTLNSIFKE